MRDFRFKKRLYCSTVAFLSLLAVYGNGLHASNSNDPVVASGNYAVMESMEVQESALIGTWMVNEVKIKKTVNGLSSEKTHSTRGRVDSFVDCPQKITFMSDNKMIFEFASREPVEGTFTVEGNKIIRSIPSANYEYEYSVVDNKVQLIYSIDYVYNHEDGTVDKITEECTFFGTKN